MPSRSGHLWLLSASLLLGLPALSFIYWPLVLRSGVLPTDADSIGIPLFNDCLLALVAAPIVLGVAWLCLRRYNPRTRLTAWRSDRPVRTLLATIIFGGAALFLTILLFVDSRLDWPWYEHLWSGYTLLLIWWFMAMRAAVVEQLGPDEDV